MERIIGGQGFEIIYHPGDRVRLIDGNDRIPCTVISSLRSVLIPSQTPWVQGYEVKLDTGETQFVTRKAIWKEADTGESTTPGRIEHI